MLAIFYIPHSGIVNKFSDYIKICQRLTNLPSNVGGCREDKIAWGAWLKLQNKYPKIDCRGKVVITSSPAVPLRL
jgi:hypothetical protein